MPRLHVTRHAVSLEASTGMVETTSAIVALTVEGGRVGIVAVGETEEELRERLMKDVPPRKGRGMAAKIVTAAESKLGVEPGALDREPLRWIHPGQDPWWDKKWQDPYALKEGDARRARNPREVLVVRPLSEESWSPHLIRGLLMYVLWTGPETRGRSWPAFRRPDVELTVSGDINERDYAELVDQLRNLWGKHRVRLPAGRVVEPPPVTRTQLAHRVSQIVWWSALAGMLILPQLREGPEPPGTAVAAGAVAAIALMTSRVLRARTEAELPRRR